MVKARKFVYAKPFYDMPKQENLKIVEEELPPLKDGEFLTEAVFLSVDPYMRVYTARLPIGRTMFGEQVAKIIESKNANFPVGKHVVGQFGWRTHTISKGRISGLSWTRPYIVSEIKGHPLSLYLGTLGMPGNTAYFGFLEICKPKCGETVVVTGAGGAIGSHVGQIAKLKGCKVIGLTGSDDKSKWLKTIGFDHVINYKTANVRTALKEAAPNGVDCYFDNIGGEVSSIIMSQMRQFGRVSVCGAISAYNDTIPSKAAVIQPSVVRNQLLVKGFIVAAWADRWQEGVEQNSQWLAEGKLKYHETVTDGFENMTNALIGILKGDNTGKAIVKSSI